MSKRLLSEGSVTKRCRHDRKEWDLCGCPFYYYVTHKGTKHRGKIPKVTTLDEARTAYALIAARIHNGQSPFEAAPSVDGISVADLAKEWLSLPRNRKASTLQFYGDHMRKHVNPQLGSRFVAELSGDELEKFAVGLPTRLSLSTRKGVLRTLRALLTFAKKKGKRTDNPATGLTGVINDPDVSRDVPALDPNDHTKYFTADEAQHLLATCREHFPAWHPFVLTGLTTGMRLGELRALRYDRINWRGGYITVDQAKVRKRITSPKNGKTRTVSMSRDLRAVLYLRWRRHRTSELVFPSSVGTPLETSRISDFWTKFLDKAEVGHRTRHAMRHTHSSLLIQAGVPPAKVAAEAGRSLEETLKTYTHFLPGGNREDAEVLSGLLGKTHVSSKAVFSGFQKPRTAAKLRLASGNR